LAQLAKNAKIVELAPGHPGAMPAWSPDGSSIAFVSGRDNPQGDIYVVDADGSNMQRLTEDDFGEAMLAWSLR